MDPAFWYVELLELSNDIDDEASRSTKTVVSYDVPFKGKQGKRTNTLNPDHPETSMLSSFPVSSGHRNDSRYPSFHREEA